MDRHIALLIDAENISSDYIDFIIDEANKYGKINFRRVYGDWTTDQLNPWKEKTFEYGLTPVQQYSYSYGKNASDFTLIIDAMDILYGGKVDSFCIVSSDSDFTKLVVRLKEDNMYVFGMGESKTPISLVNSCESFTYLDKIKNMESEVKNGVNKNGESSITPLNKIIKDLKKIINDNAEDNGWAYWSLVSDLFQKKYPGFNPRNYGVKAKTLKFIEDQKKFDIEKEGLTVFIKNKK